MANFPKSYNASTTPANAHDIHTSGGDGYWTSGGDNIDIYKFSAGENMGTTAFAVVVMKNSGASNSLITFAETACELTCSSGTTAQELGFSLITNIADATVNDVSVLITAASLAGNASFTGVGNDATNHGDVAPIGYLPISTTGTLEHDYTDAAPDDILSSASALNASHKYIPVYSPAAIAEKTIDVDASGTTHYCAIMIKFFNQDVSNIITADSGVYLKIYIENQTDYKIRLIGTTQNAGALQIQHGDIDADTGAAGTFTADATFTPVLEDGGLIYYEPPVALLAPQFLDINANRAVISRKIMVPRYPKSFFESAASSSLAYSHWMRITSSIAGTTLYIHTQATSTDFSSDAVADNMGGNYDTVSAGEASFYHGSYTKFYNDPVDNSIVGGSNTTATLLGEAGSAALEGYQISADNGELWFRLAIKGNISDLWGSATWVSPAENVSASYFESPQTDGRRTIGHSFQSSYLNRFSIGYRRMDPATMTDENEVEENPLVGATIYVDVSNYHPWTFSQETYAKFNNFTYSNSPYMPYLSETMRKRYQQNKEAIPDTVGTQLMKDFTYHSIVNKNDSDTDQAPGTLIHPMNNSAGAMIRDASQRTGSESLNANQEYSFGIAVDFVNQNTTPNTALANVNDDNAFFCDSIKFGSGGPSNRKMYNSAGTQIGDFAISHASFTSEGIYSNEALTTDLALGTNSYTGLSSTGDMIDLTGTGGGTGVTPSGSLYKRIYLKFKYIPKYRSDYGWADPHHFDSGSSFTKFHIDVYGRIVNTNEFKLRGGYNAISSLFAGSGQANVNNWLNVNGDWPEIKMLGMAWPDDPTLLAVTQGDNEALKGTFDDGGNTWEKMSVSQVHETYQTDTGKYNWWLASTTTASAANFTSTGISAISTAQAVGASAVKSLSSRDAWLQTAVCGTEVAKMVGAFSSATPGSKWEIGPVHNIARVPDNHNKIRIAKPFNWFINDHTRLNASGGRYECFIPINLSAIGDSNINILDISLANHVGAISATEITYDNMPAANSTDAKKMVGLKPAKSFEEWNTISQGVNTPIDIVQSTDASYDPSASSNNDFVWSLIGILPTSIDADNYTDSTSTVNKYSFLDWQYNDDQAGCNIAATGKMNGDPNQADFDRMNTALSGNGGPYTNTASYEGANFLANIYPPGKQQGILSPVHPNASGSSTDTTFHRSTPSNSLFQNVIADNGLVPYAYFAVKQSEVNAISLTEGYVYNKVRIRYTREVKSDVVDVTNQHLVADGDVTLVAGYNLPVYEAIIQIRVKIETEIGELMVSDLENDGVESGGTIDFGTIVV